MRFNILLLLLTATSVINAQQLLFDKTIPEQNVPQASRLKNEMRSHYVSSRYISQADFLSEQDFIIVITPNLIVKSKFLKMYKYPSGSFSYEGRLEGSVTGHITFSKFKDRTAGMIHLADGSKYMIDQVASNIFAISLSNELAFTQQEKHNDYIEVTGESQRDAAATAGTNICDVGSSCPGTSTIDLMVVYTQQAENNWSGQANTIANITQAVTNMNTSMSASGINNVTFRLVHTAKLSYSESGDFSTDLTRLAGSGDGYMDNVHSLRDQYGADLVSMVIGSPTTSCGIGFLNTNPTSYSSGSAFNVSLYSCVVGNLSMAHECGHNMGLRHDWYVDASTSPCSHNHGYVNEVAIAQGTSSPASARWRTIMAYSDRCSNAGFNCTRVNIWSNPKQTYNGDLMGSSIGNSQPSDEAYAYYRMACIVASFRPEAGGGTGVECLAPLVLSTSGITTSSATANWGFVSGANSYSVDYKASSSGNWINIASGINSLSWSLSGMSPFTSYDWRVRANCSSGSSTYTQSQFITQALTSCNVPSGLSTSGITASSATANWDFVSGANSYNVDYKTSSSGNWINIASGINSLSWSLSGLTAAISYDWRVRANCSSGSSIYSQSQFITQALTSCNAPSGLSTYGITASSATANWGFVSGANSYNVDYKTSSSGNWINIASGINSLSWDLLGMSPSTSYDWRVRANCSSGTSIYSQSQFITQALTSCNAPSGLSTLAITTSSATVSWSVVSGATSYNVDYKASSSGNWINIASGINSLSWDLLGMSPSISYDWRVRANCASGNSSYTQSQFITQALTSCNAPAGLSTSGITASSATANWGFVSGANSYNVDYKTSSSGNWINIASGINSLSWDLLGMSPSTSYDWRVRANCSSGTSIYSQSQFITQALTSCNAPSGLSTLAITTSSATASWSVVSGATSYNVDYKASSSGNWINIASGINSLSWDLFGMSASTSYDWRVRANCASGSSSYTQSQFLTLSITAPTCNSPVGLVTTNISTNSSTASWSVVSGATSYNVDYKASSSSSWINAVSGTTTSSINFSGLLASTDYSWRVRANCISSSSSYSTTQFITSSSISAPPSLNCPGPYDVSTNGNIESAATIFLNTDVQGTISPRNDIDHYKFSISSAGTITVSLTALPANYNLALLNSNGAQIAVSENNGPQNETININVAAGTYYAKVLPRGNATNATSCYTLRVQMSTATDLQVNNDLIVKLFPNPASNLLNVWMERVAKNTEIKVYDRMGKLVLKQVTATALTQLNISKLPAGFYLLSVNDGKETKAAKFVKE